MEFTEAFWFLQDHPVNNFINCLNIMVVKVNPVTYSIDDDNEKNTLTQIWLESGDEINTHDIRLDCGGNNFEEAIIELARLVKKYY